ncbi:flagellar basal body P-ring formation chaperone FlgA [Kineobactrum salinum]|uniref:Flagella basal body P-ring formation protein FlgA n=1 Tax=Kineobactrum salinum TaxID=2708301 RepID=A0A6C0TWZ2_9GAMM|nr:flagellar basal body P-ring formation chaperone FlgA [Kineobactrum salinum]QIB64342.1 flagellar basal body P-ring formation protein FlgA [Kineobactrum salinum]
MKYFAHIVRPAATRLRPIWLLLMLLACSVPAIAGQQQEMAEQRQVMDAVHHFLRQHTRSLGEQVEIEVVPPRVNFPACPNPQPFLPGREQARWGRLSVGVRCGDDERLRYLQAQVSVISRYWVTSRALDKDTPLDASVLTQQTGDLGRLPRQVIRNLDDIEGTVTRRPLAAGTVLQQALLRVPPLVERRQAVTVEAAGSGFRISRQGRAMDAGARGDRIRIRLPNREVLQAAVIGPGRVAVN